MIAPWTFPQLERMALLRPHRMDELLARLMQVEPGLARELAAMAVEEGVLSLDAAAQSLNLSAEEFAADVEAMRTQMEREAGEALIVRDQKGVARLTSQHVAVWELVMEYRRAGSVEMVRSVFPSLSETEVRAALSYAGRNPDEIGAQIRTYEEHVERARAAYPFAQVN